MNETQTSEASTIEAQKQPGPQGIGVAVAIDWGLAAQTLFLPAITLFLNHNKPQNSPVMEAISIVVALIGAAILIFFGEMVRSGHRWARIVQLIFSTILSLAGIFMLLSLYRSIRVGDFWPLITETILIVFSPLVVWRISRPATARWFKSVTSAEARQRHGGKWVWFIILWAVIGGILQTLAITMK